MKNIEEIIALINQYYYAYKMFTEGSADIDDRTMERLNDDINHLEFLMHFEEDKQKFLALETRRDALLETKKYLSQTDEDTEEKSYLDRIYDVIKSIEMLLISLGFEDLPYLKEQLQTRVYEFDIVGYCESFYKANKLAKILASPSADLKLEIKEYFTM